MSLLKCPRKSFKTLVYLTVLLGILYLSQMPYLYSFTKKKNEMNTDEINVFRSSRAKMFQGEKLIHLDLKGAPPKISYLLNFIPLIKNLGATGLLIEYEDMFPYHDGLEDITALNAYTLSDVSAIVLAAEKHNLTVIPLIPTLGHVEFVLKLEKYKQFREVKNNPQVLCPSQKNVYSILKKMIDQVLQVHHTSTYLHIGCDEAEFIGVCQRCQKLLRQKKWRRSNIYFKHVKEIGEYVTKNYPRVRPIIWGDKFVWKNERIIQSFGIPNLVEVMMWNYGLEKSSYPSRDDMYVLTKLFKNIWIANAFKGATGSTQIVTNIELHLENSKGWIEVVDKWETKINFKGIALTGWQRYKHFSVLCELLPVGIPSLALNLQYLNSNMRKALNYEEIKKTLNCNVMVPVNFHEIQDLTLLSNLKCNFPGFKVYHIIHSFYNVLLRLIPTLSSMKTGDFSFYNVLHKASHPGYVHKLNIKIYERQLLELEDLKNEIRMAMEEVYDEYTVTEWITTHLIPAQMRLKAAVNIIKDIQSQTVWPRRPFVNVESKASNFFDKICTKNETVGCAFLGIH